MRAPQAAICEQRVRKAVRDAPVVVIRDIHRLDEVAWFRNGNGRDIDVHVGTSGSYRHQYEITVSMLDASGTDSQTLHRNDYWRGTALLRWSANPRTCGPGISRRWAASGSQSGGRPTPAARMVSAMSSARCTIRVGT